MLIVNVHVRVKPEFSEAFEAATLANARASVQEPGIARFDILRDQNDPQHFLLTEVYRTPEAPAQHKETEHYRIWKETVAGMMSSPRTKEIFENIFPDETGWD
jgi:quinol monooxygenase YgiN